MYLSFSRMKESFSNANKAKLCSHSSRSIGALTGMMHPSAINEAVQKVWHIKNGLASKSNFKGCLILSTLKFYDSVTSIKEIYIGFPKYILISVFMNSHHLFEILRKYQKWDKLKIVSTWNFLWIRIMRETAENTQKKPMFEKDP